MTESLADYVRRHDPDRFLTALFAPAPLRETLFTLYAFNHEIARASTVAREPTLALIRLHWWREVAEGARRRHEVAGPVRAALDAGALRASDLVAMVDAREAEAAGVIETRAAWEAWLLGAAGGVAVAAARLLGAPEPEAVRKLGAAYGAAGVLLDVVWRGPDGRCLIPLDALAAEGLTVEAALADPRAAEVGRVLTALAETPRRWLAERVRLPRASVAAALPAVLARRDLNRVGRTAGPAEPRGVGDRLAVVSAGLRGSIRR
jgi:phytoene synthase